MARFFAAISPRHQVQDRLCTSRTIPSMPADRHQSVDENYVRAGPDSLAALRQTLPPKMLANGLVAIDIKDVMPAQHSECIGTFAADPQVVAPVALRKDPSLRQQGFGIILGCHFGRLIAPFPFAPANDQQIEEKERRLARAGKIPRLRTRLRADVMSQRHQPLPSARKQWFCRANVSSSGSLNFDNRSVTSIPVSARQPVQRAILSSNTRDFQVSKHDLP